MSTEPVYFLAIGENPARVFGMDARERACRLATNLGLRCVDRPQEDGATIVADLAFAWDPAWLKVMRERPRTILSFQSEPVMVHVAHDDDSADLIDALLAGRQLPDYERLESQTAELTYSELRKRARPFVMRLDPSRPGDVERAAYDAAYKGVTDALTLYLWRRPAFYLTRWAARLNLVPNAITTAGALLCLLAFALFWRGDYWLGVLSGFTFMVLDTVDGKLARVTGTSSRLGNIFDHGIDLVHPPFWWWAWLHGLQQYGRPLEPVYAIMVLWVILGGYLAQRLIEGITIKRFSGMEIHVWRPLDSRFRLVTARRNPNMVLLVASLLFRRPDVGLQLVAWWTLVSLIFHAVRLAQMSELHARGQTVTSWLDT